ncbi:MAG: cell envelope integrity protein TolA [Deltaproteobacteria bacterium]|nr:cell envelope integrity protein TolA [Deltaproteobacteria bacterium]
MSAGFYNQGDEQPGFGITIAVSLFLHIIILAVIFLFANSTSSKIFTAPVYTVDLLSPEKPAAISPKTHPSEEPIKPIPADEPKKIAPRPAIQEKAIVLKPAPESFNRGKESKPSLDDTIKKIQERVKKREAEEAISKVVEGLKNKQVEKRLKEVREKVVHRQVIVKPIKEKAEGAGAIQQGGAVKRIEELEEKYGAGLWEVIQPKWNYTGDTKEGEVVVISLRIDKNGHLVKSHIEQSSGNALLVQSAIRAIEKAAPLFPPLPQELGKDFVEIGVCFPECEKE